MTSENGTFPFMDEPVDNRTASEREWIGMPEYISTTMPEPEITATFKFRNEKDYEFFKETVKKHLYNNEKCFDGQQSIEAKQAWYPLKEKDSLWVYKSKKPINPQFPVYIVSKGRWKKNPTSRVLTELNVPFYIVVEKDEYEKYQQIVPKEQILILPQKYKDEYDVFWDDDDPRVGPGAARNFCWEHSIENGFDWHWVMDDNIESFERHNNNRKIRCIDGTYFKAIEDFVLRYTNIGQAGLAYTFFCPSLEYRPAYVMNTRIYSCLLIRNDVPYRWRGRYNEDTDLSLRMLKDGWCTVQFNAFLQGKMTTSKLRGGNSKEFYDEEGTKKKSQMLADMHPDVAKVSWMWNRWHHKVDYRPFSRNKLIKKDLEIEDCVNDYGMELTSYPKHSLSK